ncbi:MAG: FIST C-terminal domain-containing protein [Treponema sp.]|nr:FIST C-terminal domain-containing protein [Treponema sp.]
MVKMLTAYTFEIDDADAAVREIQKQLRNQGGFLKNTVGLLFCYLDFIKLGTAEAICKALPFDTLGCTTLRAAVPGAMGDIVLTLTVLTSDDIEFHAGLSEPLTEDVEGRIIKVYRELAAPLHSPPALIFIITPLLLNLAGDTVVGVLDRESRGIPVFGTGALDADTKIRTPKTIYGGRAYSDRMPVLLFLGNLKPRFFVDSVWKYNIHTQKALITSAEGNRMITVNNIPAAEYIKKIGIITDERLDLLFVFPLAIYTSADALPNLFVIYTINDDGSLTCSANIPSGSTIHIGSPGFGEIINTVKSITDAVKNTKGDAALIFSCFSRSIILTDLEDEMETIRDKLKDTDSPYTISYSGGEICPVYDEKGRMVNQYHNYAIVSCVMGCYPPPPPPRHAIKISGGPQGMRHITE